MPAAVPEICQLAHASFRMLGEPLFRLSEGTLVPSMVVQLDKQEAVLPLRALAREFGIEPESPDGRMLRLIEQALDYVALIRPGDRLPSELFGGEASWEPTAQDRRIAGSRIRYNLVRCVFARTGTSVALGSAAPGWEDDAKHQALVNQAIADAARIESTAAADIIARVASISEELAYIESMRRILTRGLSAVREKLMRMRLDLIPFGRMDTVKQVQLLARTGIAQIGSRFDDVDVRLDDVLVTLRNTAATVGWLRKQRDWLFRTNQAWGEMFSGWASAPNDFDDFLWKVVERSYLFLAPRFMTVQEWKVAETRLKKDAIRATVW